MMSFEAIASRQIQASSQQLLKPKVLAEYLLEDTFLLLDKQSIEPLHESKMLLASAAATAELEIITDVSMSNTFCSITRKRLEEKIRLIIGHSPDIVDDILKPIIKAIEDLIEFVVEPIGNVVDTIKTEVRGGFSYIRNVVVGVVDGAKTFIDNAITASQGIVTEAVGYIEGQVTGLLDFVADPVGGLFLILEKVFGALGDVFKGLLSMEPKDIISLQMELTKLAGETIVKAAQAAE